MCFAIVIILSLCPPFGSVHGQPPDEAASGSRVESRFPASLTATQALQGMLELIQGSHRVTDITPETVHRLFGVQTQALGQDEFGYGQRLQGNWAFSLQRLTRGDTGPRMDLIFDPIPGTPASPLPATCEPDFARFTGALESMGFRRQSRYGEHGRWISDVFERQGMSVEVFPLRASADNGEPLGPTCVKMVLVR
ncbi:hypothetical protein CFB89_24000 [Burkholderia sp. AU16741]|nr:hypothetical protein CFB89_24000 [Burkholderia sp. AU16741]